jgi:hypothetical protein
VTGKGTAAEGYGEKPQKMATIIGVCCSPNTDDAREARRNAGL